MNEQRNQVVQEALTWLGTPWRHGACIKNVGVDCGQFIRACFESITGPIDIESYNQDWALHRSEEKFLKYFETYAHKAEYKIGLPADVALFKYGRCLSHAAIIIKWPTIIHSHFYVGSVVTDDIDRNTQLVARFAGLWSYWE
jgi:cell wall-associated NlpC family hydrolase